MNRCVPISLRWMSSTLIGAGTQMATTPFSSCPDDSCSFPRKTRKSFSNLVPQSASLPARRGSTGPAHRMSKRVRAFFPLEKGLNKGIAGALGRRRKWRPGTVSAERTGLAHEGTGY